MGFKINYEEKTNLQFSINGKGHVWGEQLYAVNGSLQQIVSMASFRGRTADSMKSYISEVHGSILAGFGTILGEISSQYLLYRDGYYSNIDDDFNAILDEDTLDNNLRFFCGSRDEMEEVQLRMQQLVNNISDIMAANSPNAYSVRDAYETVLYNQYKLKTAVSDHETYHSDNDFTNLDQLIQSLGGLITQYLNGGDVRTYVPGSIANSSHFHQLDRAVETALTSRAEMSDALQRASEREQVRMDALMEIWSQERVSEGNWQRITGALQMLGGALVIVCSVASLIVTGGASAPLAIPGIIGGVGMITHGHSRWVEGSQNVHLGETGNLTCPAINPLRDNVLARIFGEENKYTACRVFGITSNALGILGSAGAGAWSSAVRSGVTATSGIRQAVVVGEIKMVVSVGAGMLGNYAGNRIGTELWDENVGRYVGLGTGLVAGIGTRAGLNNVRRAGSVDRFIQENVHPSFQKNVKNAFEPDVRVTTLTKDTIVYRYHGGNSGAMSYWFTPKKSNNPAADLALPRGNSYTHVDVRVIPKGTTVLEGTVAPNFGQPGGGLQIFVPNPLVVK